MKYNGWENYQTWATALWYDNDQGTYEYMCKMAREFAEEYDYNGIDVRYYFSKWIRDELEEQAYNTLESANLLASLLSDLLTHAIAQINFYEVAEHFLEDIELH